MVGGAIFAARSNISVHSSTFEQNSAELGGAIYSGKDTELTLTDCEFLSQDIFIQNTTDLESNHSLCFLGSQYGSAIFADGGSRVVIRSSLFQSTGELSIDSFGIIGSYKASVSIQRCHFHNTSGHLIILSYGSNVTLNETLVEDSDVSAGIIANGTTLSSLTSLEILNSTFVNNNIRNSSLLEIFNTQVNILNSNVLNTYLGQRHGSTLHSLNSEISISESAFIRSNKLSVLTLNQSNVTIFRSSFVNNSNEIGAIYILNGGNVIVNESVFIGNFAQDGSVIYAPLTAVATSQIVRSAFVDNTNYVGAVYVNGLMLHVDGSTFERNSAFYGTAIYALNSSVTMSETSVVNNRALVAGVILLNNGALTSTGLLVLNNTASTALLALTSCTAVFRGNTTLANNFGSLYAIASTVALEGSMDISKSTPFANRVIPLQEGGAVTVFQSSVTLRGKMEFTNNSAENGGAIFVSESRVSLTGDIIITNNHATLSGGGVYLFQSRLNLQGACTMVANTAKNGGGMYGTSSTVTLEDDQRSLLSTSILNFTSNAATLGGALFLSTNTKIYDLLIVSLSVHRVYFTANRAEYGGALYIADQTYAELCNSSNVIAASSSMECFFQILALHPEQLSIISEVQNNALSFNNNYASVGGDDIFGGLLDRCRVSLLNPSRAKGIVLGIPFLKRVSNINGTSNEIASYPVRLCLCVLNQPDCSFEPSPIYIKKGETFNISIIAVDQINHLVASDVMAFLLSKVGGLKEGQQQQSVGTTCTDLSYTVTTPQENEELVLNTVGPCESARPSQQ